jgi:N-acetylmuramoyl-L-alanine amidase
MKTKPILVISLLLILASGILYFKRPRQDLTGAPPYGQDETDIPPLTPWQRLQQNWQRPDSPPRVGLQVGHLNSSELPEELKRLRNNSGATAGGYTEVEVNQVIANKIAKILRQKDITVDILPATIPPNYWADVFIAIHADGSTDTTASGFKIASPWRDLTKKADQLVQQLESTYQEKTNLKIDPNITRNMRGYYAFSWWRYNHAIHPMSTAAIVEMGFLTNRSNRQMLTGNPDLPAKALAQGIVSFLKSEKII